MPAGVTVGALPVGGFTSEEAAALVRARLAAPVEFELEAKTWTASPEELGVSASVDEAIAAALAARTGDAVEVDATPSRPDLLRYVTRLAPTLARRPVDAHLAGLDAKLRPLSRPAISGRRLDLRADRSGDHGCRSHGAARAGPPRLPRHARRSAEVGSVIVIRRELEDALPLRRPPARPPARRRDGPVALPDAARHVR